jgi:acetyl esterase/lipase
MATSSLESAIAGPTVSGSGSGPGSGSVTAGREKPEPAVTPAVDPKSLIEDHILPKLDPDFLQFFIDVLSKKATIDEISLDDMRAHPERFRPPTALDASGYEGVSDHEVTSKDGAKVPVRVYLPDSKIHGNGPYPVHLNFHGMSWLLPLQTQGHC